jgi:hypothetical protein
MSTTPLDEIFEHLSDGDWHTVHDLYAKINTTNKKLDLAITFLAEQHLIEVRCNEEGHITMVRLSDSVRKWYLNTKEGGL